MQLYKMTMKNGDVYWVVSYSMEEGKARIEEMCLRGADYALQEDRIVVKIEIVATEIKHNYDGTALLQTNNPDASHIMDDLLIVDTNYVPYWEKE